MNEIDNGTPIVLMGHSMGGGISIVLAARDAGAAGGMGKRSPRSLPVRSQNLPPSDTGKLVDSLTHGTPSSPYADTRIAAVIAEGAYRWPMEPIVNYLHGKRLPPYPFTWFAGWHFAFWLGISNRSFDRARHAAKLRCPLLVIHGDADAICPLASARAVAEAAPNGRLVVVAGAAHADLPILYRDRYLDALRPFFHDLQRQEVTPR